MCTNRNLEESPERPKEGAKHFFVARAEEVGGQHGYVNETSVPISYTRNRAPRHSQTILGRESRRRRNTL